MIKNHSFMNHKSEILPNRTMYSTSNYHAIFYLLLLLGNKLVDDFFLIKLLLDFFISNDYINTIL